MEAPRVIDEFGKLDHAPPGMMDWFWADGWRHFGSHFFRYNQMETAEGIVRISNP